MVVGEHHGSQRPHRVAGDDDPIEAGVVEQRGEVVRVLVQAGRSGQVVAAAAAAQVGREHVEVGHLRHDGVPRPVVGGDAVHGQHGRRRAAALGAPPSRVQQPTPYGSVDRLVAHRAVHPPSMLIDAPVTMAASSPAR